MKHGQRFVICMVGVLLIAFSTSCRKKTPVASLVPPAPAPAAPAPAKANGPTISTFVAEPNRVTQGQSAILRWEVRDATTIQIDQGLGSVPASGNRTISPNASTTYTLTATGSGGTATAATTLNVTSAPPPPLETKAPPAIPFAERLSREVQDAYFDFDKFHIRDDAIQTLTNNATALKIIFKAFPNMTIVLEGHCDERGSAEYNLGLGDRRASSVKEFLEQWGLPALRLITVSYGKERPQCTEANEACWQNNRRVHFAPGETQNTVSSRVDEAGVGRVPSAQPPAEPRPDR